MGAAIGGVAVTGIWVLGAAAAALTAGLLSTPGVRLPGYLRIRACGTRPRSRALRPAFADPGALGWCVALPGTVVVLVGWPWGLPLALAAFLLGRRRLRSVRSRGAAGEDPRALADLPLVAELLASSLAAGAPVPAAVSSVGRAVGGATGSWLVRVANETAAGADPSRAWEVSGAGLPAAAAQIGVLMAAAQDGGLPPITALREVGAAARAAAAAAGVERARRAGVRVVAPLGLCFLPAFVLVGVVPIAAGAFQRLGS